jgi:hypothetical protein
MTNLFVSVIEAENSMLQYRNKWLTIAEVWFDEPSEHLKVDVVRYNQAHSFIPGAKCKPFYTLVIDLGLGENDLWTRIDKDTRYEIRRAKAKDRLSCGIWDQADYDMLEQFTRFYNSFAVQKRREEAPSKRLEMLARANMLDISWMRTLDEGPIVYHVHILAAGRPRLLYSASLFRSVGDTNYRALVGRANRLLHWEDIVRFKAEGMRTYDFGGWYEGKEDAERLRINTFKAAFGGSVEKGWDAEKLVSRRARLTLPLARRIRRTAGFAKKTISSVVLSVGS